MITQKSPNYIINETETALKYIKFEEYNAIEQTPYEHDLSITFYLGTYNYCLVNDSTHTKWKLKANESSQSNRTILE